jgi:Protein of unknown function (DUF3175)
MLALGAAVRPLQQVQMARKTTASAKRGRRVRQPASGRRKSVPSRRAPAAGRSSGRRWSQYVTEHSDALTLDRGVFTWSDPKRIAASLKRSAEQSRRRKADPFRSALSMLTFYINRAGRNLPAARKRTLMRAKDELRRQFGKE